MKALIIADDANAIERFSAVLNAAGYELIVYRWLIKALDNIEEIAPHLILVSAKEYPRHWKTLASYVASGIGGIIPQVILYTDKSFSEEENKKAMELGIRGTFSSYDVDGLDRLRKILSKEDDIYMGKLDEPFADSSSDFPESSMPAAHMPYAAHDISSDISFIFINPENSQLVTGKVLSYSGNKLEFEPSFKEHFATDLKIHSAMLKINSEIKKVNAVLLQKEPKIIFSILSE